MKITNDIDNTIKMPISSEQHEAIRLQSVGNFSDLKSGDKFIATIKDINPSGVTLGFKDGSILLAKSLVLPDAHIGDDATFLVTENLKGQILLEMVKSDVLNVEINIGTSVLKEAFDKASIPFTRENVNLVNELIKNNLPLSKNILEKAVFFKYSAETLNIKDIVFLIKENFPANQKTIETYLNVSKNPDTLKENIKDLIQKLSVNIVENKSYAENLIADKIFINSLKYNAFMNSKPSDLEKTFLNFIKVFRESKDANEVQNVLKKLFFHDFKKTDLKPKLYFNNVSEILKSMEKNLSQNNELKESIEKITELVLFYNKISETKEFFQFPFLSNNNESQFDLHVFGKRSKSKKTKSNTSAFLDLNTENLGNLGVFINRNDKKVSLDFKNKSSEVIKIIKAKSPVLISLLKERGFDVEYMNFNIQAESLSVPDTIGNDSSDIASTQKRYSFDMRI